jgi:signal transduction histidine kinase
VALDELGGILSVLRQTDDSATSATSVAPLPTLDQLDELIADFAKVGLDVDWHTSGARRSVAPAVGLAAYRIVQESLTNAHRHGRGPRVHLRVDHRPDALVIDVVNDITADVAASGRQGHGIVGMRERAIAAGGRIDVGPTRDGRFRVHVSLPVAGALR